MRMTGPPSRYTIGPKRPLYRRLNYGSMGSNLSGITKVRPLASILEWFLDYISKIALLCFTIAFGIAVTTVTLERITSEQPTLTAIEYTLESLIGIESMLEMQMEDLRELVGESNDTSYIIPTGWPFTNGLPATTIRDDSVSDWAQILRTEAAQRIYLDGPETVIANPSSVRSSWFSDSGNFLQVWKLWGNSTHIWLSKVNSIVLPITVAMFVLSLASTNLSFRLKSIAAAAFIASMPSLIGFGLLAFIWRQLGPSGSPFADSLQEVVSAALWVGLLNSLIVGATAFLFGTILYGIGRTLRRTKSNAITV